MEEDQTFGILSNSRRRHIVESLQEVGGEASLREVIRRVALAESEDPDRKLLKSIHTGLLQNHIPKMQEMGVIVYNQATDTIRLTEEAEDIKFYLEKVNKKDVPWSYYYLILAVFALVANLYLVFISGFWIGNYFGLTFSIILLISAIYHTFMTRHVLDVSLRRKMK